MDRLRHREGIRVMVVCNQEIVRAALCKLLESQADLKVIGGIENTPEAVASLRRLSPEVLLLDLCKCSGSGPDLIPEMISCGAKVLLLSGMGDSEIHRRAVRMGAMGLVRKEDSLAVFLKAIQKVHAGEVWLDRRLTAELLSGISRSRYGDSDHGRIAELTEREREIIVTACAGLKNRQIAERLCISESTVRNHLTSILSKLGLSDRFELSLYSFRHGLAVPPACDRPLPPPPSPSELRKHS